MKVFISSVMGGFEEFRSAAMAAVETLGHELVIAEGFEAAPTSPRVTCLSAVRASDLVILILGQRYGAPQPPQNISPTHEEYLEAKDRVPVLAFIQTGVDPEPQQQAFIEEVEAWVSGGFRGTFSTPSELQVAVTRAIHQWELSAASAPVDADEIVARATGMLPDIERGVMRTGGPTLHVSIAGGPTQQILRPSEIEEEGLRDRILQRALFGAERIFSVNGANSSNVRDGCLQVAQGEDLSIRINEEGSLLLSLRVGDEGGGFGVIIEEVVREKLRAALAFGSWLLDDVDSGHRLSRIVVMAQISGASYVGWRTHAEQSRNPNSYSLGAGFGNENDSPVRLQPPDRARTAISFDTARIVEDLLTLLRRQRAPQ